MNQTTDATAIFAPLWRRKWLILAVGVLVAVGTYFYYKSETPNYLATTQIYLGAGAEEQAQISGTGTGSGKKLAAPEASAQVVLINSAIIQEAVREQLRKAPKTRTVRAARAGKVKAKSTEKSEFITLSAEARNARGAALLANLTAQTYVKRQNGKYRRDVEAAIALTRRQLRRIEASQELRSAEAAQTAPASSTTGKSSGSSSAKKSSAPSTSVTLQAANLSSKINQLEADLGIVNVKQVDPAKSRDAQLLSPTPKKNAIFGFAIGVLLAAFAVYALARLDRRLRSLADVEATFQAQILSALRSVGHPIVHRDGQPMPSSLLREPIQRLHTSLQMGNVQVGNGPEQQDGQGHPRTILFVSADAGDGKSTVVADLALIQRDAGEVVAIVEADLRRPVLAELLGVGGSPGLADVLEGRLVPGEAFQDVGTLRPGVGSHEAESPAVPMMATVVQAPATGSASILVGGTAVVNPPALLASPAMGETLRAVAEECDYVLVDAPPPLEVSDVMPLLRLVDGIVIVARVGQTREASAQRLVQLLARTPSAPVLGVVANGVSQADIANYGFSAYGERSWRSKLIGR